VEITAGSLGQGYGVAAGIALGAKMNNDDHLVYSLIGDGECYEGSIWETAMFVGHHGLDNLITIIDRNNLCVTDFTEQLIKLEPMEDKWRAFGFDVVRLDGHDIPALLNELGDLRGGRGRKPLAVIADTVKGKGVDSMSNSPLWHGAAPTGDFAKQARSELRSERRT